MLNGLKLAILGPLYFAGPCINGMIALHRSKAQNPKDDKK